MLVVLTIVGMGAAYSLSLSMSRVGGEGGRVSSSDIVTPLLLKIPKIAVSSVIDPVGLSPDGAMEVPTDATHTGWYELGPRPGEIGSAVIDGHFSSGDESAATFKDLHLLTQGDLISVTDTAGVTTTFIIREVRLYDQHADTSDVFLSSDGKSHLNLITCEGAWIPATQSYSRRLVVFGDRV